MEEAGRKEPPKTVDKSKLAKQQASPVTRSTDYSTQPSHNVSTVSVKPTSSKPKVAHKGPRAQKYTRRKNPSGKPTRPLSAYNLFYRDERVKWLAETAQGDQSKNSKQIEPKNRFLDMGKAISGRWRLLSGEERIKYEEVAQEDKKRYDKEMTEYNERILRGTKLGQAFLEGRQIPATNSTIKGTGVHTTATAAAEEETGTVAISSTAMIHPQPSLAPTVPAASAFPQSGQSSASHPALQASLNDHRDQIQLPVDGLSDRNETVSANIASVETASLTVLFDQLRQQPHQQAIYEQRPSSHPLQQVGTNIFNQISLLSNVVPMQPGNSGASFLQKETEQLRVLLSHIEQLSPNNIENNVQTLLSSLTQTPSNVLNTHSQAWNETMQQQSAQQLPQTAPSIHLILQWLQSALASPLPAQSVHGNYGVFQRHHQGTSMQESTTHTFSPPAIEPAGMNVEQNFDLILALLSQSSLPPPQQSVQRVVASPLLPSSHVPHLPQHQNQPPDLLQHGDELSILNQVQLSTLETAPLMDVIMQLLRLTAAREPS